MTKISIIIASAPDREASHILNNLQKIKPDDFEFEIFIVKGTWPPIQRNLAIKKVTSRFIFFFDDDVIIPPKSIQKAMEVFQKNPHVQAVGGPNLTPPKSSFMQHCFGHAQASFFIGLTTTSRYKIYRKLKKVTENNLATCNLAFRAEILKKNNFNTNFYANEENDLLGRIVRKGGILAYNPDFFVYHHRRKNLAQYLKQIFAWGEGRTLHTMYSPSHFKPTFFIPLVFFLYIISFFWIHSLWYLMPFMLYIILDIGFTVFTVFEDAPFVCSNGLTSLRLGLKEKNPLLLAVMFWLFPITHITYGLGTLWGFFTFFKKKRSASEHDFHIIKIEIT